MPMKVPIFLSAFWSNPEHRVLAWGGLVWALCYEVFAISVISQEWTRWGQRWSDLLQASLTEGADALPRFYKELWYFAGLTLLGMVTSPINALFFNYWGLRWEQAVTREYTQRWPLTNIPEGSAQRVDNDTSRIKGCVMWVKSLIFTNFTVLFVYVPMLKEAQKQFPCPDWLPLPSPLQGNWALVMAMAIPLASTYLSFVMTNRLYPLEYAQQKLAAYFRRLLVLAEDTPIFAWDGPGSRRHIAEAIDPILRRLVRLLLQIWSIVVVYDVWLSWYGKMPEALLIFGGTIHLFGNNNLTLGDLRILETSFGQVFGVFSMLVGSFGTINDCRATLRRLLEFEAAGFNHGDFCVPPPAVEGQLL
jgi:ABC-type long-subunit fatty acid transport system fused permease/ATPase subunit